MPSPDHKAGLLEVPERVRDRALANGDGCVQWLTNLPDLVSALETDWAITVGSPLSGGTASLVVEAVTAEGSPAVLKLAMPSELEGRDALVNEIRALVAADGRGCARVLAHDAERGAVLLERLGRKLVDLELPVRTQLETICAVLTELWAVAPDAELPSGDAKGRWLANFIATTWEKLDRPCSTRLVERAVFFAERRCEAFDAERAVLVHGDAHPWNTLEDIAAGSGFRLVDPDGLLAEREYDLSILMREFNDELLGGDALRIGQERARFLARLTGLDEQRIWEWGLVEKVSNGLMWIAEGDPDEGRQFLRPAEVWAAAD